MPHPIAAAQAAPAEKAEQPVLFTRSFNLGFLASFLLRGNFYLYSVTTAAYCMARYGVDTATAGLAVGIFTIGCLVSRLIGGPLVDRFGLKPVNYAGFALTAVASLSYLVLPTVWPVVVVRFLHGMVYGVASTTSTSTAAVTIPGERHGEGMGYFMLSVTLASAVGPLLGMVLLNGAAYTPMFVIGALMAVAGLLASLLMGDPDEAQEAEARVIEDVEALEPDAPCVALAVPDALDPTGVPEVVGGAEEAAPSPMRRAVEKCLELSVLPVGIVVFISYLAYGGVSAFLDPFAEQANLMGSAMFFFVAYALAMLVSRPFTAKILDRRGPAPLMVPGFVALALGVGLMGLAPNSVTLLVSAALIGLGIGAIQPTGLAMATTGIDKSRFTVASATFYMMSDTATGIAPIVFGLIVPFLGYRGLFDLLVLVALAGGGVFLALYHSGRIK